MNRPCIPLGLNSVEVLLSNNPSFLITFVCDLFFGDPKLNGQIKTPPHALSSINLQLSNNSNFSIFSFALSSFLNQRLLFDLPLNPLHETSLRYVRKLALLAP
jgi:hypothetical protein